MSDPKTMVFVARYDHKHGSDVRVFRTQDAANGWADELGSEWWETEFDDEKPATNIGDEYFERQANRAREWFTVEQMELEG